jgi:flagellar biosynthesis chaperone FliJ
MTNHELEKLIKQFSVFEWLVFIKVVETMSGKYIEKLTLDESKLFNLTNSNWYPIIMDLAIRFSSYDTTDMIEIYDFKMNNAYQQFIPLYVNHHDDLEKYKKDLKNNVNLMLSRAMNEQLRHTSPYINSLGRLIKLYEGKDTLFKQEFGLTNKQMIVFYFMSKELSKIDKSPSNIILYEVIQKIDSSIKKKDFERFLNNFSISIKNYRLKAKELGITKHTIKCERLIYKYPIIIHNASYMIPSMNVLLDVLSYKIFDKLNENSSESFKRDFGDEFENYIREMTQHFHDENMYECDELITKDSKKRAEFYLLKNNISLVIEAKVLAIDEKMIIDSDIKELEKKFKNTIGNAIKQMNSCSDKCPNMYGLIVIHTHIPTINNFFQKYKSSLVPQLKNKVVLISVVEYENLISKSFEKIIEQINLLSHNSFNIIESTENEYLRTKYNEYITPIIETIEKETV